MIPCVIMHEIKLSRNVELRFETQKQDLQTIVQRTLTNVQLRKKERKS